MLLIKTTGLLTFKYVVLENSECIEQNGYRIRALGACLINKSNTIGPALDGICTSHLFVSNE